MSIEELLYKNKVQHHFQPIFNINEWKIIGYEALIRVNKFNPEDLFSLAIQSEKLYELDTLSIENAVKYYSNSKNRINDGYLFLNIYPSTILNPNFDSFINEICKNNLQIVLEINEAEIISDFDYIVDVIHYYRKNNKIIFALDDVGKGNFEIMKILEIQPEIIKVDSYMTNDLIRSPEKRLFLNLLSNYCKELQVKLIVEGIKRKEDIDILKEAGIKFGQGYALGRPMHLD